ncbi:N-acetylglucosamine 6-phosphate deacetylase [Virgibacillus subterraneus]|uniref:N-acetylglucosamine 6-phosphate deacetylase n=1 Tax=Virgibacillus subterraneus TaxID=621109 RepID=A0A1H9BNE3_9BACI|nr:N-acetylglucosamine-6-phosphate deacetylase [Virgibacillus subterraneus]SEP90415.1 N-acetylglucosamine 6-phosphate deacetylase [Virgibacillus subterraneus]
MKRSLFIKNATIFTESEGIVKGSILLEDSKIKEIHNKVKATPPENAQIIDGQGLNLIPGFIDGHIHGAAGADVMDSTEEALDTMAEVLPKEGTTSFLATTITQSPESIDDALRNVAEYTSKCGQAEVMGVHLEGPFIEKSKKGAQPLEYIMKPDIGQFKKWQQLSGNKIETITLAPEHDEDGTFIRSLYESGVNVSAGHTGIGFEGMKTAVDHGVRQVTHICNAMTGIHHRDIGVVGAAFQLEELRAELIADGIHVSPEMLQLIYSNMGSERLILITDAMRAKCLHSGAYELGGQPVNVTEDRAVLGDGTLAGSILKMYQGAQQMLQLKDVSIKNVIEMASSNPAKQLGIFDKKGSVKVGKDADLLLVDDDLQIKYTICRGEIAHKEE